MIALRKYSLCIAVLLLVIMAGCNLLPGSGGYSVSDTPAASGELLVSRDLTPSQSFEFSNQEFSIFLPAGSLTNAASLEITRIAPHFESHTWEDSFIQVSSLYRIALSPDPGALKRQASISFQLSEPLRPGEQFFSAYRSRDNTWEFSAVEVISDKLVMAAASHFYDWVLIRKKRGGDENLPAIYLTASPGTIITSAQAFVPDSLDLSVTVSKAASIDEKISSQNLRISASKPFKLQLQHTGKNTLELIVSDKSNTIVVDLLDSKFVEQVEDLSAATHSIKISFRQQQPSDIPDFLNFAALIDVASGLKLSASKNVYFENSGATPTDTQTQTQTSTGTGTETGTSTPTETQTQTQTQTPTATTTSTTTQTTTQTVTQTSTSTGTGTGTGTSTPTETQTQTQTQTPTATTTSTTTQTTTQTQTQTSTGTGTGTGTGTSTPTETQTHTQTQTQTPTATTTSTTTQTTTQTVTQTSTSNGTGTGTGTSTPTETQTQTQTQTPTATTTSTTTQTTTQTVTQTSTSTGTGTGTDTSTPTETQTQTQTQTPTATTTSTTTQTTTQTETQTSTGTGTGTGTGTSTPTETQTQTQTQTSTSTGTDTGTGTGTSTPTETQTQTATDTFAKVVELIPASGSLIAVNRTFVIKFDQAMNTQLTQAAVSLPPVQSGGLNFSWSALNTTLTLTPQSYLAFTSDYHLAIASSAISASGSKLDADYLAKYATATQTKVLSSSPANAQTNVATGTSVEIFFSRNIAAGSLAGKLTISSGSTNIAGNLSVDANRVVFTPGSPLPWSSNISVAVSSGITDTEGFLAELPYSFAFTTQPAPLPEFLMTSAVPANGSTGLPVNQTIDFLFSNPVNKGTLSYSFLPMPSGGIAATWSNGDKSLHLAPVIRLAHAQNYQITVNSTTRDTYGSNLATSYPTSFTTGPAVYPVISSTNPAAGSVNILPDQQFQIVFSKTMNRDSTVAALSISPAATGNMGFAWQNDDKTLTLSFSQPLAHATSYQLKIASSAADTEALKVVNDYLLSFSTTSRPAVLLTRCSPASGSIGVSLNSSIKVEFSKTMNQTSAQNAFSLVKAADQSVVPGTFSWSGNIMTFAPAALLGFYTSYQVSIAATAQDLSGITMESATAWQFKTAADEGRVWRIDQTQASASTFPPRKDHVMINFNNKLWVIGGHGDTFMNDVWSSNDGISWTSEVADGSAGMFAGRAGHACAVFNGRIWLTGGHAETATSNVYYDDVWSSADGKAWVQESASAEYYSRAWHSMVVYDSKLWIVAGETVDGSGNPVLLDECWSSSNGSSWQLKSNIVTFFPRKQAQCAVLNGKLWLWGGYGKNASGATGPLSDIWSTTNGNSWNYEKSNAGFPGRCGFGLAVFNGRIWITGGATHPDAFEATFYNDVWASNDGLNWVEVVTNSAGTSEQFTPRASHSLVGSGTRLYLSGGENRTTTYREVWSTQ